MKNTFPKIRSRRASSKNYMVFNRKQIREKR
jgi:hypothetical protein